MSAFVRGVCQLYPETFVDHDTIQSGPVPLGWRGLVLALLGDLVDVLGPAPSHRIAVMHVGFDGGLRFVQDLRPLPGQGDPDAAVVSAIVSAAERRSRGICDQCALPGDPRRGRDGRRSIRCDAHADVGRRLKPTLPVDAILGPAGIPGPTRVDGFTGLACAAFPDAILDATGADEVPAGWYRACSDLLFDVAAVMTGARDRRLELRRLHADGDTLRWDFALPPSTPAVVRRGVEATFRRAAEEAGWTCRSCGRRDAGLLGDDLDVCPCGIVRSRDPMRPPVPLVTLPILPPEIAAAAPRVRRSVRRPRPAATVSVPPIDSQHRVAIYRRVDVAASLGLSTEGHEGPDLVVHGEASDTEQQARLQALLTRGEKGRWRSLARPKPDAIAAVDALTGVAPHLEEAISHVVRNLRAAAAMRLPVSLPPTVLLGPPGVGKTWLATRLSQLLGLPYRLLPMNLTLTSDGISGAHPVWRNSSPGVVAKVLLAEEFANPLVVVDEFDKARQHNGVDPYSSFYTLLEPVGARAFVDEYFGIPFDASRILWVMSANDLSGIPEPIVDRLTVIEVPQPGPEHTAAIVDSVYADANAARSNFFSARLDPEIRSRLANQPPRSMRVIIEDAMTRAAAVGRRGIAGSDLVERWTAGHRPAIGFVQPGRRLD